MSFLNNASISAMMRRLLVDLSGRMFTQAARATGAPRLPDRAASARAASTDSE
jgi:ABC-type dipeptide/oligopeptide/nickel transport system permease component